MTQNVKVLMVEDSETLTAVYRAYLENTRYEVATVSTLAMAHTALGAFQPDILLLDIELPDGNGMELLAQLKTEDNTPEVIVMTAHGTSDMAVEAIRHGAVDFLTKPFDSARLRVTLDNTAAQLRLGKQVQELSSLQRERYGRFIGASPAMQSVYKTIDSLAASTATAFIVGESGTGKELAAEAIHQNGQRADKPFIALNCAAIPSELMESELFGHVKGAFTGASNSREGAASMASGGTLFLDEICEMSMDLQKKLLRFIQTGTLRRVGSDTLEKVDVRFVCATNRDPLEEVREGRFREDLFYRLHVVPLRIPPLRERDDDVLIIANELLERFSIQEGKQFHSIDSDAARAIRRYAWPGNVRQLENVIQQAIVLNDGNALTLPMLPPGLATGTIDADRASQQQGETGNVTSGSITAHLEARGRVEPLWLTEKNAIEHAIAACNGNVNRAAGLLEVAPSTIYRKLQSWRKLTA